MATQTKNLKLVKPTTSDPFSTTDIANNWQKLDDAPGTFVCTSTSRPTLAANQAGRKIYETDTKLDWTWTGTAWERDAPRGLLRTSGGDWAHGVRTSDFQTTSTTPVLVLSVQNVVVPPGNRTLAIQVTCSRAYSVGGYFYGRVYRSNTSNSGPLVMQWAIAGGTGAGPANGGGASMTVYERGGLAPGVYSWSFQIHGQASAGQMTVTGTPTYPSEITVVEI